MLPSIETYGHYSSSNYGAHCLLVRFPNLILWFSYKTCVAFQIIGQKKVVSKNNWGPTTGKHLNWIDGGNKKNRVSLEMFNTLWDQQVCPHLKGNTIINLEI